MEPPAAFEADAVRAEKVKVLQSIRPIPEDAIDEWAVRGQYGPGVVEGKKVPGYREEENVDARLRRRRRTRRSSSRSTTGGGPACRSTCARASGWRKRVTEIAIEFKRVPHRLFAQAAGTLNPNVLRLRIQPDEGVSLKFEAKIPGTVHAGPVRLHGLPVLQARRADPGRLRAPAARRHARRSDALHPRRRGGAGVAGRDADPEGVGENPPADFPNYAAGTSGPSPRTGSSSAKGGAGGRSEGRGVGLGSRRGGPARSRPGSSRAGRSGGGGRREEFEAAASAIAERGGLPRRALGDRRRGLSCAADGAPFHAEGFAGSRISFSSATSGACRPFPTGRTSVWRRRRSSSL